MIQRLMMVLGGVSVVKPLQMLDPQWAGWPVVYWAYRARGLATVSRWTHLTNRQ